jgi:hypothetical protein
MLLTHKQCNFSTLNLLLNEIVCFRFIFRVYEIFCAFLFFTNHHPQTSNCYVDRLLKDICRNLFDLRLSQKLYATVSAHSAPA